MSNQVHETKQKRRTPQQGPLTAGVLPSVRMFVVAFLLIVAILLIAGVLYMLYLTLFASPPPTPCGSPTGGCPG